MQAARESPHRSSYPQALASLLVGAVVLGIYLLSPIKQTGSDSRWTIYLAESLIYEGNLDLDEYRSVIPADDYRVRVVGGHIQSYFPVGTVLVAVPFVFLDNAVDPVLRDDIGARYAAVEQAIAAIITAATCVLVFLIARRRLSLRGALLITAIFAFGTAAWSTASRALWQHSPSMLALTVALYLVLLSRERPRLIQFAGIPLAFAYVIRPTNSIPLALFSLFVLFRYRRYLLRYLFWAALILALFVGYSYATYQTILPPYYLPGRIQHSQTVIEALAGTLVSPSRGLFVFSPILVLAFYGFYVTLRSRATGRWDVGLAVVPLAAVVLHWIVISSFPHWWGGASYGPRLFSDVLPYLAVLMIPAI